MKIRQIAFALTTVFAAGQNVTTSDFTILQNIFINPQTSIMATLLSLPSLRSVTNTLHDPFNPVTFFAPDDEAFRNAGIMNSTMVAQDPELSQFLLTLFDYHTLSDVVDIAPVVPVCNITEESDGVIVGNSTNSTSINNSHISIHNTTYNNTEGFVQVIIIDANSTDTSNSTNVTSNASLPTIYSGLGRNSSVIQSNITALNGVLHIIDRVFTLPGNLTETLKATNQTGFLNSIGNSTDSPLLSNSTTFTGFVPLNTNLTEEQLPNYISNNTIAYSTNLTSLSMDSNFTSLNGTMYNITGSLDCMNITVNGALVNRTDVIFSNGVLHFLNGLFA